MPKPVGIDLGTTHSAVAAYMNKDVTVIPVNGENYMPSVVSFCENEVLVGSLAEEQAIMNPENTIFGVKRIMGREFNDPKLQEFLKMFLYSVENVDGKPKIRVNYKGKERLYDPEQIAAMIVKKLKITAEITLGHKVKSAVIAVPAFFNDSQRQAAKDTASLAGLEVLQILNEPTAVAVAYGLDKMDKDREKYVLIYDFGSGMFDVSILKIKYGSIFETVATVGDTCFGGFEIDQALMNFCADLIYKEHKKDIKSDARAVERLRLACSHAKGILSRKNETSIIVDAIMDDIDFQLNLSRTKFEELCEDIFNRTIELLHQVVVDSGVNKTDIDDVVLVGGPSRIPKVRQLVSNYFDGRHISRILGDTMAVVRGAAIQAAVIAGYIDSRIENLMCYDVTLLSIGLETSGGIMTTVIKRGSPLPAKATITITTNADNQSAIAIRVLEGERALAKNNHFLGTLKLCGLPSLPRGVPQVEVTFDVDLNGILTVSAAERTIKEFKEITINLYKDQRSEEDIRRMLKEANVFGEEDKIERDRIRHLKSLEKYIRSIGKVAFADKKNRLSNREKLEINKIATEIRNWLDENSAADIQAIDEKLKRAVILLQPYAKRLDESFLNPDPVPSVSRQEVFQKEVKKCDSL